MKSSWIRSMMIVRNMPLALLLALICVFAIEAIDVTDAPELPPKLKEALQGVDLQRFVVVPQPLSADASLRRVRGWTAFQSRHAGSRSVQVDSRTNVPLLIEGRGIPFVPGSGNRLTSAAFGPGTSSRSYTMADMADAGEAFIAANRDLLRSTPEHLIRDEKRSVGFGNRFWSLRYQQVYRDPELGAIPVHDAYVFLRVNQGNLVQFGNRLAIAPQGIDCRGILSRRQALERILSYFDNPSQVRVGDPVLDIGQSDLTLQIAPHHTTEQKLGHQLVRSFLVETDDLSLELWLDAHSGELVHAIDRRLHVDGAVTGGIYPVTNTDPEVLRGMPYLDVVNGAVTKTTDLAGVYDYSPAGSLATATLDGDFVSINDDCGTASVATSLSPGDLSFGQGAGTDCDTPGSGGAGNTHAARSTYYHLNQIKEKARRYLNNPVVSTPWLDADLTANVNINNTCNAFWSPLAGTVNFYRSGGGCSNTGEIAAIFLHEFGHGLDQNTNGSPPERGSGEAYSDVMAFLQTHDPCIGHNFQPGVPCLWGCDASCTGVRDVDVGPNVTPANIAMAPADCDRTIMTPSGPFTLSCPFLGYEGPMGYEGHCESLIASGAVWDMVQGFVGRYGEGAGWALADRIWYESLYLTGSAYQLAAGEAKCDPTADVNGCGANNWYTVFLALDDDNGDLTDGTPNADLIWNAFNDHGIACGATAPPVSSDCPVLAAPGAFSVVAGTGQVNLSWGAVTGAASYRVFRNSFGCDQGSTPIAEVTAPTTFYTDTSVSNGTEYFYSVQAVGVNNVCVSSFTTCDSATPTTPLEPVDIFMVLDESGSMSGATEAAGESKIDALHDAALMVVDLVEDYADDGFRLGATSFSTTVTGTESLKDLQVAAEKTALESFITGLTPTDLTAIGQGINEALSQFPAAGTNGKAVMLLSDGLQNVAPLLALKTPPPGAEIGGTALPSDVRFFTVALGTAIQENLFDDLAGQGGIPGFYYSGGTADIQSNFGYWVADVLGLDPDPPFGATGPNTTFEVNRTARRITFLVTWLDKGTDLRFHLDTPVGRIDPPRSNFHPDRGYASYTIRLPLLEHGAEDHVGPWTLRVVDPNGGAPDVPTTAFALFDDPVIDLEYQAGGSDPGAGEAIPLEVRVTENGQPISGLNVRVKINGPEDGIGEILSTASPSIPVPTATVSAGGDPLDPAAQKLALLLAQQPELFADLEAGFLTLSSAGPGIYRATLPAARTVAAGTYDFTFEVQGQGQVNDRFVRSRRFSRYLRVKPIPEATEVVASIPDARDLPSIHLLVTPRDRNLKRVGPGWAKYISAKSSVGSFAGDPVDNLDGSYTFELLADPTTDPTVEVEVLGEPVAKAPVSRWLPGTARRLTVTPFFGATVFDSSLPIDDGPVFGWRFGVDLNNRWSLETEIGSTVTDDVTGDSGVVLQLSQNALYYLRPQPSRTQPFVTLGLGTLMFNGFAHDDHVFALNLGLGAEIDFGPGTGLRLDLRDYLADDAYGTGTSHNLQASFGFVLSLP